MALYVVLGAGVVGLTTALELKSRQPSAQVIVAAKYLPGDRHIEYTSPWAGANWLSVATDNGRQESWDAVTYRKFEHLADHAIEAGVRRMPIRALFDNRIEDAGVLSQGTGKVWYEELVGGIQPVPQRELPPGTHFGFDLNTLQVEALKAGIEIHRRSYEDIRTVLRDFSGAAALFNCTGLSSYHLKGVEDHDLYPTRGQVMLVESPRPPIRRMYFRSPKRVASDTTYVFPRGEHGGVILGGCRMDGVWDGEMDPAFADDIKRRCCALCPELGRPEDLKVISHGVGLRPGRKGGARIEREHVDGALVIHNYGAGGAGYQASW
ncbi:MAG: hypothetical protein M1818_003745 [Claussenomyces sp. TS43310]|nr:MAG: hypothetical protein M1818_003745 [Claussenomyces sp. TS43310]